MLRDRGELEKNLSEAIERIKHKRKNVEIVNKTMAEFGVAAGFFNEVMKNLSLLGEIETSTLCLMTVAIFKVDGNDSVRPESYFTEGEIEESKNVKVKEEQEVKLPITVPNVLQIDHDQYVTVIKIIDPVKWYHSKVIEYDFETQRSPKFKKGKDGVVPIPDVNIDSVKDIAEHMLNETYIPDMITLNVYSDEFDPLTYNPKTKMLTIREGATVSILDGFHRLQGAVRAATINPDIQQDIILSIRSFDADTAKKYFGQINTINVVKSERLEELKQEKISYVSVKQLQINSDLKGRIASGARISEVASHLTTVDILANAIEETFEPKNTFEAKEIGLYLTDYFNYLLGMFDKRFNTKEENDLINHQRTFIGHVVFAKQFRDNNIPLKHVKELVDNFDFTTGNKELTEVILNNRGNSLRLQRKVKEYFDKINVKDIIKVGV